MEIQLEHFDATYLDTLQGKDQIKVEDAGVYYTITCDGACAGVVGYIPSKADEREGFVQIVLDPKFRGKGIVQLAEDMVAKKHDLKKNVCDDRANQRTVN